MTDNVDSLILKQLRRIHQRMDRKDAEDLEVRMRLSSIDDHLAGLMSRTAGVMTSVAGINGRLDRLEERVGRIERRLDLTDAR